MRPARVSLSLSLFLIAAVTQAQQPARTDAETDGLAGPVKAVSTSATHSGARWEQPNGPTLLMPIWCWDCQYDADGTRTVSGQMMDGKLTGEMSELQRDGDGHPTGRRVFSAATGELFREETLGPFGKTAMTAYSGGKVVSQQTFRYDANGHLSEWISLDSEGKQLSRSLTVRTKDGVPTESSSWGKNDELESRQTYDPKTDETRFTSYDDSGAVKVSYVFARDAVVSFWEASEASPQYGDRFIDTQDDGTEVLFQCHKTRPCERFEVKYEYLSPHKRNPKSAEWRDAEGHLLYAAYYEYRLDSHENWTHRSISVLTPELGARTPYEDDTRTIVYWQP